MPTHPQNALIAIGSNQKSVFGDVRETAQKAMELVANLSTGPFKSSNFYRTPAFPPGSGADFVNAAIMITTDQTSETMLQHLHRIEARANRVRDKRWGPRTLDLDLIAVDRQVRPDAVTFQNWHDLAPADQQTQTPDQLVLPHPRLQDRAFVLVPLADIAPDWAHPILGKTIRQMCEALPRSAFDQIVKL